MSIDTVEYRALGNTGLSISEIGFGCGPTAGLMIGGSPEERRRAIARALEVGICYFDTAPVYGDGLSEIHLGEALRELGAHPIVGTKVALRGEDLDDIYGAVIRSVEASLARLKKEEVEVVHLHNRVAIRRVHGARVAIGPLLTVDEVLGPRGVLEAFEELRKQGKVRFFGCCAFGGEVPAINQLIDSCRFHSLLAYYNILNPTAGRAVPPGFLGHDYGRVIDRAASRGMGVIALRVLAAGALSGLQSQHPLAGARGGGAEDQANQERAKALSFLTQDGRYALAQSAVRFALMKREVSTVLVGFSSLSHLEEAAACSGAGALPPELMARLEELHACNFGLENTAD